MFRRVLAAGAALGASAVLSLPAVLAGPSAAGATTPSIGSSAISDAFNALHGGGVSAASVRHAADTQTYTQPGAPTDVSGNAVAEPRAAITKSTADYNTNTLTLSLTPGQWSDAQSDQNWLTNPDITGVGFSFFAPQSQTIYAVAYTADSPGPVLESQTGASGTPAPLSCPGLSDDLGQVTHEYTFTIPDTCFGSPAQLTWLGLLIYDPVAHDDGTHADGDLIPDNANLLVVSLTAAPTKGYWLFAQDGGVFSEGNAGYFGSLGKVALSQPIVAAAATPETPGYIMAAADGGVFTFGSAKFYGSLGKVHLRQPIVAMAEMPKDDGYWLFASDGGVFTFGSAAFYGSLGNIHLSQPIVAGFAAPDGDGYTLVAADGGVFTFGSAGFYGSLGNIHLSRPIVAASPTLDGAGYWLFGADGGVFTFGDAPFLGSLGSAPLARPIVGAAPANGGYRLAAADGGVFCFGAAFEGSEAATPLHQPIVAIATAD